MDNNNNDNNNYQDNLYAAVSLSSCLEHFESSPSSFDKCRKSATWPPSRRPMDEGRRRVKTLVYLWCYKYR